MKNDQFNNKLIYIITIIFILMPLIILYTTLEKDEKEEKEKPELLIYCGTTMIDAISEIAEYVKKEKNCIIKITKGGSGSLLRAIKINKIGDLYLPGSDSYIKQCQEFGLINMKEHIGYNLAVIVVPKGNPKKITNDPIIFTDKRYKTIFADQNSGSIGRMTNEIFKIRGIEKQSLQNVLRLTPDSKDITKAIINEEADVGINWLATIYKPKNRLKLDGIFLDKKYATPQKLVISRLTYSKNPEIAAFFIQTAMSPKGQEILKNNGFINNSHDK